MPDEPTPTATAPESLRRMTATAAEQAGRWGHVAATILRAGVVPFPQLHRGLAELVPLVRYGTTLGGLFAMAAASTPHRLALIDEDRSITYAELERHVRALAHGLSGGYGVSAGSAVGILARNHIGFVETVLACNRLGADVILLNTGMSPAQAATVAEEQDLALLVVDTDLMDMLAQAPEDIPRVRCGVPQSDDDDSHQHTFALTRSRGSVTTAPQEPGRTVVMTSGTTGAPKGARRPSGGGPDAAASILSRIPFSAEEVTYIAPPLYHTWGFANLQIAALLRSTVVLRRRFDPAEALRLLSVHRCTTMAVVPVMLQRILDLNPAEQPVGDLSALRIVASSGSALPASLPGRWMEAYGPTLYNLYGSTEVSWATIATPEELRAHPDTAGRPPRGTLLAILDEDGAPVADGEVGRIFVGNDLHFDGYTGDAPGKQVIDGMMATGDVGRIDAEGLLFISGRDDDMIVSGGENVFPKEVEDLLSSREDVVEAAVLGVDDDDFGQRLAAFVVLRDPDGGPDAEALKAHVKEHLARFSVPRDVVVVDELPRNPTGKVLLRELRSQLPGTDGEPASVPGGDGGGEVAS